MWNDGTPLMRARTGVPPGGKHKMAFYGKLLHLNGLMTLVCLAERHHHERRRMTTFLRLHGWMLA